MKQFRKNHLLKILYHFDHSPLPIDVTLHHYFKQHSALGSKDRKEIAETIYFMIRNLGVIDCSISPPISWEKRLESTLHKDYEKYLYSTDIPLHKRLNFPKNYFDLLSSSIGEEKTIEFCRISNQQAPISIRSNPSRISRDELLCLLQQYFPSKKTNISPFGIELAGRNALFELEEFKKGFFEMQDEGSQLVALEVAARPGDHVLDYCAGSGGKSLAYAYRLEGKGQIFLHDIRLPVLDQAKKRFNRAGIQNYQLITSNEDLSIKGKRGFDWILLDVPCSGSGTLRRNPDQKWKFDTSSIDHLVQEQRLIFDKVYPYLKESGKIVYATCSILTQ
ncbi:MAG: RsmB/NOP family class I SAM-dependent RNA methyltransferase [Chlamydiales bacterium]|nr:RsmB/NOP family class I SAM-dependent RNA methyltransferase [Chlamydiales bacterium]